MTLTKTSNTSSTDVSKDDGLKVIHAGLYRTGTASMAEAYRILEYKTHHALANVWEVPWIQVEQAAEATWPHLAQLPEYTYRAKDGSVAPRPPFKRADWQKIWGDYDIATDVASTFSLELIEAYPDAKVVVVQRKYESWWPSFESELLGSLYKMTWLQNFIAWKIMRFRAPHAMRKVHAGFFSADEYSLESIEPRARDAYEEYYRRVREAVPIESGRRLEYTLGDGWEPLCEFLGKEVPDVEFPRVNDRASHGAEIKKQRSELAWGVLRKGGPIIVAAIAAVIVYRRW
ncbi:hypothetical protein ACHAPA_004063 [Fusarium lateritium]